VSESEVDTVSAVETKASIKPVRARSKPSASFQRSRLSANILSLLSGQVVTWGMALGWTLVVPRVIGAANMGLLVTGMSVAGVFGIVLGLGTRNYLVREFVHNQRVTWRVRRRVIPDEPSILRVLVPAAVNGELIGTALVLRLLLTPVFAGGIVAYVQITGRGGTAGAVIYLSAMATLLLLFLEPMQAAFQAVERMGYIAISEVVTKSAQGVLGLALVGFGVTAVAAGGVVAAVVALALNIVWLRRQERVSLRTSGPKLLAMTRESLSYWAFGFFFMIYLWIDAVMLSIMTRPEVVGWYGVSMRLFQTLMFFAVVISTVWLPRLVSRAREDPGELLAEARLPVGAVLVVGLPVAAATVVTARPLLDLLYGGEYRHAAPVLAILGLCVPAMYLNIVVNQVLVAANRQKIWTWVMAGATIVNPALNAGLIWLTDSRLHNGAIGAAISLLVTEVLIVVVGLVILGPGIGSRALASRVARASIASLTLWGVTELTKTALGTYGSITVGAVAFLGVGALLRVVTLGELSQARAAVRDRH
jgi:O-antigen/teichoic acid export membrane protein